MSDNELYNKGQVKEPVKNKKTKKLEQVIENEFRFENEIKDPSGS